MAELSFPWDGTATGDANIAPYNAATEFASILELVSGGGARTNEGGVFFGYLNDLLPSSGGVSPVSIASGAAIGYGTIYTNSTSVNVAVPTPAGSTRIDRIVLRKSWSAQTIRLTRIAGAEGGAAPAMTQTPGVTWDTPIARASITTGGVITIIDDREPVGGSLSFNDLPTITAFDVTAAVGTSEFSARANHVHEITDPPAASSQLFNDVAIAGVAATLARSDHVHGMPKVFRKYSTGRTVNGAIDPELQFPVLASERYIIEGTLIYSQAAANNLLITTSMPVGGTDLISVIGPSTADVNVLAVKVHSNPVTNVEFGSAIGQLAVHFRGTFVNGGTAGTFGLVLGDNTPVLAANSHLIATQI